MPDILDPASRIDKLLSAAEPRIARVFREAIASLKDSLDLDQLERELAAGNWDVALEELQAAATKLGQASTATFITSGQDTAAFLQSMDIRAILFDVVNVQAVQQMQLNQLQTVTSFTQEQRDTVHATMLAGIAQGLNPREQARNFRDVVGLTPNQAQAVLNYRRLLESAGDSDQSASAQLESLTRDLRDGRYDASVRRAVRTQTPLSREMVDRMVQRYTERYIKYRSEVIGRTEALRSVNQGVQETYRQAIEDGTLNAEDLDRTWDSSGDGRVRASHRHLDGMKRPWGETWPGYAGPLRYPGDPLAPAAETVQCRCIIVTRIRYSSQ